jgi:hypothetical protein
MAATAAERNLVTRMGMMCAQVVLWFLLAIALTTVLCGDTNSKQFRYVTSNCTEKLHDYDAVKASAAKAKVLLQNHPDPRNVPFNQRILFMILFSKGFNDNDEKVMYLKCALNKLKTNMMPTNTIDIFVWVLRQPGHDLNVPDWVATIPRVNIMEIEPSTWQVPCGVRPDSEWALRYRFSLDYYLMGRWRLTFSFDFAKEMGYAYNMQYDDESLLNTKVPFDLGQDLMLGQYSMAVFTHQVDEIPEVIQGLTELTRYWLTVNHYTVAGPLFKHVVPHNLDGLTLDGWDRLYYRGNALATSVDFWFQADVQDYLMMVLKLGRDVEGRWQEQAVMNMIRLVFMPEDKLLHVRGVEIGHDRGNKNAFYGWCVRGRFV